jgi:hypothetical protein
MKNCHKSCKHFGGSKAMRPISKKVRAHVVSLVMKMPVGPLIRLSDEDFDALVYVWFEQPPNDTLKDLGLIMATFERLLGHLQALRTRRVAHCGDNRHGIQDDFANIMVIACGSRISYQPDWAAPQPKAKTAEVGRNVRPRMEALPAPDPVFAIGDERPQFGDLRVGVCSVTRRPKLVSVVSGRWAFAGRADQVAALVVENCVPSLKIFDSVMSTAAEYIIPLQTFVQVLAVWYTAEETPQPIAEAILGNVRDHGHVHARVQQAAAPPPLPLNLQRVREQVVKAPPLQAPVHFQAPVQLQLFFPPGHDNGDGNDTDREQVVKAAPLQAPVQFQAPVQLQQFPPGHDNGDGNDTDEYDADSAITEIEAQFMVPKASLV